MAAVEGAIAKLKANPQQYRLSNGGVRKANVERFPYSIIYWLNGQSIHLIAVMHLHREPDYWRKRLG